jgi:hypothetical protein
VSDVEVGEETRDVAARGEGADDEDRLACVIGGASELSRMEDLPGKVSASQRAWSGRASLQGHVHKVVAIGEMGMDSGHGVEWREAGRARSFGTVAGGDRG